MRKKHIVILVLAILILVWCLIAWPARRSDTIRE